MSRPRPRLLEPAERHGHVGGVERVDPDDAGAQPARQPVGEPHVATSRPPPRGRSRCRWRCATASSGSSNSSTASTGPKISSRATRMSFGHAVEDRRRQVRAAGFREGAVARPSRRARPRAARGRRSRARSRGGRAPTSDPSRVAGSSGSAGASASAKATSRSRNASLIARWTRTREPGVAGLARRCRRSPSPPRSTAASRSGASARTSCGLLPPSSSWTGLRFESALAWRSRRPVSIEPVNASLSTPGWRASASPTTRAAPGQHVEDAVGQPGLRRERREPERGERRLARGLEDDRVAGRERRAELPGGDDQRVVPGHERRRRRRAARGSRATARRGRSARPRRTACRPPRRTTGGSSRHPGTSTPVASAIGWPTSRLSSSASSSALLADEVARTGAGRACGASGRAVRPAAVVERRARRAHGPVDVPLARRLDLRDHRPVARRRVSDGHVHRAA